MCRPHWHHQPVFYEPVFYQPIHPFYEWVVDAPVRDDVDEMSLDELRAEVRRHRSAEMQRNSETARRLVLEEVERE